MSTFLVPDIHGKFDLLLGLLKEQNILDEDGNRINHETTMVQMGDLGNCVARSINNDICCLERAEDWFDVYLIGNHEYPYFGGPPFTGFFPDVEIEKRLLYLNYKGLIRAAHEVDGILITHAGVIDGAVLEGREYESASEWAVALNTVWDTYRQHSIFTTIGLSRGGVHRGGGVLWSDWGEPKSVHFPQIVGHTIGDGVRLRRFPFRRDWLAPKNKFRLRNGDALCLDLGVGGLSDSERIAGCWIQDGWVEVVFYEQERRWRRPPRRQRHSQI